MIRSPKSILSFDHFKKRKSIKNQLDQSAKYKRIVCNYYNFEFYTFRDDFANKFTTSR